MQNPNASQWNIDFRIGHVNFMLFVLILFLLVTQREPSLQWNMGFIYFESPQNNFMGLRNVIDMRFSDMKDCWYLTHSYQLRKCLQTDVYMTVLIHM